MKKSKKIALCGIFSAMACITFAIENLFPPLFIPGAKLGLSNLFVLLSLIIIGIGYAFMTLGLKVLVGGLIIGFSSVMYALPSGILALVVEIVLLYVVKTSVLSASVAGAVICSLVQNVVFCIVCGATEYLVYLPYLALISVIAGLAVGFACYIILKRLPKKQIKEDIL